MTAKQPNPFYLDVLLSELKLGKIGPDDSILVVCGGNLDRVTLLAAGFKNVVISNLAPHAGHDEYEPYTWRREDVENLSCEDKSFDIAIVHSGLHHCYNPNRGLGELCRVARKLTIAFEPYETWFTRLGAKLGYGQQYEDLAVHGSGGTGGGVANTEIPNFVYRYTDREINKFTRAFFPYGKPIIRYYRALRINQGRFQKHQSFLLRSSFKLLLPAIRLAAKLIPSLNNNFCFVIDRPCRPDYHPWIQDQEGTPQVNTDYLERKYGSFPRKG